MRKHGTTRKATLRDTEAMAPNMRWADVREVRSSHGHTPLEALRRSVELSTTAWASVVNGKVVAMFGVAPSGQKGVGTVWLLGSHELERHPGMLLDAAREHLRWFLSEFPVLCNYVDARNTVSLRWVRRLGFTVHPAVPYGPEGAPFHLIELRRPQACARPQPSSA